MPLLLKRTRTINRAFLQKPGKKIKNRVFYNLQSYGFPFFRKSNKFEELSGFQKIQKKFEETSFWGGGPTFPRPTCSDPRSAARVPTVPTAVPRAALLLRDGDEPRRKPHVRALGVDAL